MYNLYWYIEIRKELNTLLYFAVRYYPENSDSHEYCITGDKTIQRHSYLRPGSGGLIVRYKQLIVIGDDYD